MSKKSEHNFRAHVAPTFTIMMKVFRCLRSVQGNRGETSAVPPWRGSATAPLFTKLNRKILSHCIFTSQPFISQLAYSVRQRKSNTRGTNGGGERTSTQNGGFDFRVCITCFHLFSSKFSDFFEHSWITNDHREVSLQNESRLTETRCEWCRPKGTTHQPVPWKRMSLWIIKRQLKNLAESSTF